MNILLHSSSAILDLQWANQNTAAGTAFWRNLYSNKTNDITPLFPLYARCPALNTNVTVK